MEPSFQTLEEIVHFLQDGSDPYLERRETQPIPEPPLCLPETAPGEALQQGSRQSQGMPASRSMGMTSGSCDIPGRVLTQNSAAPPGEDLDTILDDLMEIIEHDEQVMSCEEVSSTAGSAEAHAMGTMDCQKANVTARNMPYSGEGSWMQDTSGVQTLTSTLVTTLCGEQVKTFSDNQTLSWDPMTMPSGHQTLPGGLMTTSVTKQMTTPSSSHSLSGDQMTSGNQMSSAYQKTTSVENQSLSGWQMSVPSACKVFHWDQMINSGGDQITRKFNGQNHIGGQMMTSHNCPPFTGGDLRTTSQPITSPDPGLPASTGSTLIQKQLSVKNWNIHTKSSSEKKCEGWKPYVCPQKDCGKSYLSSSHLRAHQHTHSGQKPYECTVQGCEWRFHRSDELKRHMQRHTGEQPYTCNICTMSFHTLDHMKMHQSVHR